MVGSDEEIPEEDQIRDELEKVNSVELVDCESSKIGMLLVSVHQIKCMESTSRCIKNLLRPGQTKSRCRATWASSVAQAIEEVVAKERDS